MSDEKRREAARQFYQKWVNRGKEDEDDRSYWLDFLQKVLGIDDATDRIDFQKKVKGPDGNIKRIDAYIPETRVLIEQKSLNIDLSKPQSGHNGMTPYEQAKYYDNYLPFSERARWIITSNFAEIWIYDMDQKKPEPVKLLLSDLPAKYHMLEFLVNKETQKITNEMHFSNSTSIQMTRKHSRALTNSVYALYSAFMRRMRMCLAKRECSMTTCLSLMQKLRVPASGICLRF